MEQDLIELDPPTGLSPSSLLVSNDSLSSIEQENLLISSSGPAIEANQEKIDLLSSKLQEMTKAFKALRKKSQMIENTLKETTPISTINSPADVVTLSDYLKSVSGYKSQLQELKEIQALENKAKAEMYLAFNAKDEELANLRQQKSTLSDSERLKMKEVALKLRKLTEKYEALNSEYKAYKQSYPDVPSLADSEKIAELECALDKMNSNTDFLKEKHVVEIRELQAGFKHRSSVLETKLSSAETKFVDLESLLKSKDEIIEQLTRKLDLHRDTSILDIKNSQIESEDTSELNTLREQVASLLVEISASREKVSRLDAELAIVTELARQAESDLSNVKISAFEAGIQTVETTPEHIQMEKYVDKIKFLETTIVDLRKRIASMEAEEKFMNGETPVVDRSDPKAISQTIVDLENELSASLEKNTFLSIQLTSSTENIVGLNSDVDELNKQIVTYLEEITTLEKENRELKEELAAKSSLIAPVQEKILVLEENIRNLETERNLLMSTTETYNAELQLSNLQSAQLKETIAQLEGDLSSSKTTIDSQVKDIALYKERLDNMKNGESLLNNTIKDLKLKNSQLENDLELLNTSLNISVNASEVEIGMLKDTIAKSEQKLIISKNIITQLRDNKQTLPDYSNELISPVATLHSNKCFIELEAHIEVLKKEIVDWKTQLTNLSNTSQAELQKVRTQLSEKLREIQQIETLHSKTLAANLESITSITKERDELSTSIEASAKIHETEIELLQKTISNHNSELENIKTQLQVKIANEFDIIKERDHFKSALEVSIKAHETEQDSFQRKLFDYSKRISELEEYQTQLDITITANLETIRERDLLISTAEISAKVREDENIKLQEKISELSKCILELEEVKTKLEASIAVHIETIKEKEAALSASKSEIEGVKEKILEEEEKKNKSISLLRNSKNRIVRLETDMKAVLEEFDKYKKDNNTKLLDLGKDIEVKEGIIAQHASHLESFESQKREFQLKQATAEKLKIESEKQNKKFKEISTECEKLREQFEIKSTEFASLQSFTESQTEQLKSWQSRLKVYEEKFAITEEELETSRKLFESKSMENDQARLRISELELKFYNLEEDVRKRNDEKDVLTFEIGQIRNEVRKRGEEIERLKKDLMEKELRISQIGNEVQSKEIDVEKRSLEVEELKDRICSLQDIIDSLNLKITETCKLLDDEKATLCILRAEHETLVKDKQEQLQSSGIRESHLKNMNKTLKEEIRKLTRGTSTDSQSATGRPSLSAHSSTIGEISVLESPADRLSTSKLPIISIPLRSSQSSISQETSAIDPTLSRRESISRIVTVRSPIPIDLRMNERQRGKTGSITPMGEVLPPADPEYLKNVFIKFIESRDKRKQLVSVLAMLLNFTPEELRRAQRNL